MKKICLLFIILFSMSLFAQPKSVVEKFAKKSHIFKNTKINYRFFEPATEKDKKYPLILSLHGAGERGSDNKIHISMHRLATVWAETENQKENPCFVVAPQCSKNNRWVDIDWTKSTYNFTKTEISNELATVHDLIEEIVEKYPIDKNRIYITGLSMGGFGTWYMIMKFPNLFAAAIPMSGAGSTSSAEIIKDIPLWVFHGEKDFAVPVEGSRKMVLALQKLGREAVYTHGFYGDCNGIPKSLIEKHVNQNTDLLYTEYCGKGHVIWSEAYNNELVRKWLFQQSK